VGTIPDIFNASSISGLDVSRNSLHGEIPSSIGRLANLTAIYAAFNELEISISTLNNVLNRPHLLFLDLSSNKLEISLSGVHFPVDSRLQALYLRDNRICGDFSNIIVVFPDLTSLYLGGNSVSGTIPSFLALAVPSLRYLDLGNNNLEGDIPPLPSTIQFLDVSSNKISMLSVDDSTRTYNMVTKGTCSLSTIILKDNRLSQSIDLNKFWSILCETPSLSTLDISFNSIPEVNCSVINSVFPLTALFASNNQLSRASDIFPFLAQIAFLQVVDFGNNKLEGELPLSFSSSNLQFLQVEDNSQLRNASISCEGISPGEAVASNYGLPTAIGVYSDSFRQTENYFCPDLNSPVGAELEIEPSYYGYCSCYCQSGYGGAPPHCQTCPTGHFSEADPARATQCQPCQQGSFSPKAGQNDCLFCEAGTYASSTGASACSACPVGTYSSVSGASVCNPCPAQSFAPSERSTSCQPCRYPESMVRVGKSQCQSLLPVWIILAFLSIAALLICLVVTPIVAIVVKLLLLPRISRWMEKRRNESLAKFYRELTTGERLSDLQISFDNLLLEKDPIGFGAMGVVYKAKYNGTTVAVKSLSTWVSAMSDALDDSGIDAMAQSFMQECELMSKLRHPNLLLLVGACTEVPNLALVLEYMDGGSMYEWLHHAGALACPMEQKVDLALQVLRGCIYLHDDRSIVHGDIKSLNVLLNSSGTIAKICDYGSAVLSQRTVFRALKERSGPSEIAELQGVDTAHSGVTLEYAAPELLLSENASVSYASDVYAFGVLLWEIVTQRAPYVDIPAHSLDDYLRQKGGCRLEILGYIPVALARAMQLCWAEDSTDRPTMSQVFSMLDAFQAELSGGIVTKAPSEASRSSSWKESSWKLDDNSLSEPLLRFSLGGDSTM
jgi:serine/threonine protein kinase/Leucine-rich repeat (LRR) protein